MPQVSNVKLSLKKEKAKPSSGGGATTWAGSPAGDWKATVTCDIDLSKNEENTPHHVVITLYGIAESFLGGPTDSWVFVHRFSWIASKGGYSGATDHVTVSKSEKKFSRHNYLGHNALDVNQAVQYSLGPGLQTATLPRPEKIWAHVFVQAPGIGAASDPFKITV
jgi:hypothetical protein